MKLSEVTTEHLIDFGRLPEDENPSSLSAILAAGKAFVLSYTGLTAEQAEEFEDLPLALLVLCCEMYDNRALTVAQDKLNPYVMQVLAMHAVNYI